MGGTVLGTEDATNTVDGPANLITQESDFLCQNSFDSHGEMNHSSHEVLSNSIEIEPRQGRGLPLWSSKFISVLLDGITANAHLLSDDLREAKRAWQIITKYTKEVTSPYLFYSCNNFQVGAC